MQACLWRYILAKEHDEEAVFKRVGLSQYSRTTHATGVSLVLIHAFASQSTS